MTKTEITPGQRQFASDNRSGICPEAWDALARSNKGHASSYASDEWTKRAEGLIREVFERDCDIYFTATGSAANSLAIASLCHSFHSVICHEESHIETDECHAPGFFAHGVKLSAGHGPNGKLTRETIEKLATERRDIHSSKPRMVSLTQATEMGTLYTLDELRGIVETSKRLGLAVQMDGARFANAVVALNTSPAELSWKLGIDVLCFGGTKNGMSSGEAILFFDKKAAEDFGYRRKQAGHLLSKMRFVSAQWVGMLEGGSNAAWIRNAKHTNAMAKKLESALRKAGIEILFPVEANAVFVKMAPAQQETLHARGWEFYTFINAETVRFMASWDTTEDDIARLMKDIAA